MMNWAPGKVNVEIIVHHLQKYATLMVQYPELPTDTAAPGKRTPETREGSSMTEIHGFVCLRDETITELSSRARLYEHSATSAELLSLENDDENKSFGITFRTPPADSTGVAHILEHAVLCGSRKYPLKEPFVELIKGSLKTFINAFTFPDKTCYPLASQNTRDFYNLIDVYLDAVFHPRLTPAIFQQEGWHYEITHPDDPLVYKGVVFNEMKGAYSSPERLLGEYSRQSLFPETTYGVSSGGHPREIPTLTYEQLRAFHQEHYHPSNARIFFYGDDDPEERLRIIDGYLREFGRRTASNSVVGLQPPFETPRHQTYSYIIDPHDSTDKKSKLTVNWVLGEALDAQTNLAFHIMGHILVGTLASPLRKALIESGLGEDVAGGGVANGLRQSYFSTGLKGIATEDAAAVENLVLQTLADLVRDGIDPHTIEASLNTIEFRLRENNTGSFPRGLSVMMRTLGSWLHGGDPIAPLTFETPLSHIKAHLQDGKPYFETMINHFLLANPHRTTVLLQPDPALGKHEQKEEQARLEQARAAMRPADIEATIETTRQLKQMQETPDPPEALATIPRLQLEDLDRFSKHIPIEISERAATTTLYHDLGTNGILYLDVGMNLASVPEELLPYVPLFGRALREMGTKKENYTQLTQRIGRQTGGISTHRSCLTTRSSEPTAWFFVSARATMPRSRDLLAILHDILLTAQFDNRERFEQIVLEARARKEAAIIPGGSELVHLRLRSYFNQAARVSELMGGVSQLFFLRRLVEEVQTDWPAVRAKLEHLRTLLLNRSAMLINVTLDRQNWQSFTPELDSFLAHLPLAPFTLASWSAPTRRGFEGLTAPTRVNNVGKTLSLFDAGYTPHGSVSVITNHLRTTWLWERVRMQGGAYGSFCRFGHHSGLLSMVSYRDPNLRATLDVYDQASHFLRQTSLSDSEVSSSIIGTIGSLDAYQFPDAKGFTSMVRYLTGQTDESRQQRREEVLTTTANDFRAFADVLDHMKTDGIVAVLGSPEAIEQANAEQPGFLTPLRVI